MLKTLRGEIFLLLGALLFAFNGVIAKIVLDDGLSAWRLTQIRTGGAFLLLVAFHLLFRRHELKTTKSELPWLIAFGIVGVALVQAFYFVAIAKMYLGIALLIEFTAPIWILLFLKFVLKKQVPAALWYAIFLSFSGLILITKNGDGASFNRVGLIAALLDALCLAAYFLIGDKLGKNKSTGAIMTWGFGITSLFLLFALPLWSYPTEVFSKEMDLLGRFESQTLPGWILIAWIIVMGTILPYICVLNGLKLLSASTASIFGMIEPVLAGMFAWWWLSQSLNAIQLAGCVVIIVGIFIADKARTKTQAHS